MKGSGSISVQRLRVGLLVGAGLLVGVIAAFLGYAHYRARRVLKELPGRLGMDIRQETNGFTYSQSNGPNGRTIYTIHAAKMVQRKDGKVTLHDVGIVLYGNGKVGSNRVDRIYGNEFEYDQSAGLVRAMGEVHIDLQAPAPVDANSKVEYAKGHGEGLAEVGDERMIHVKTSGLVFLQKLATAATDQDLEFVYRGMTGHAHGAEYNSDTGLLILQSAVKMNGLKDGQPVVLTAMRAELDRQRQQAMLMRAEYTVVGGKTGTRRAKAERVTAYLRHDGTVERGVGEGGVSLADDSGATMTAARGEVHLDGKNLPQTMAFSGSVRLVSDGPQRQARGEAEEAKAEFDEGGQLRHVALAGGVHLHERLRDVAGATKIAGPGAWSERDVVAKALDMEVAGKKGQRVELRQAKAVGDARMTVVTPPAVGAKIGHQGSRTSVLSGDALTADFIERDGRTHVKTVRGAGHTGFRRVSDAGATATSQGETLESEFRSATQSANKIGRGDSAATGFGADEIVTAVQQGHVSMTNLPVAKAGAKVGGGEQKGSADRAVYDGASEKVTLTGTVQLSDANSVVWADRIVMDRETGDGVAEGSVKASYVQPKDVDAKGVAKTTALVDAEPVHVMATRGELKHGAGQAKFYGDATRPARLWQGGSQVEAPELEFAQHERRMVAHGDGRQAGMVVHAVFVTAATSAAVGTVKTTKGTGKQVPVRVASHEMTYDDVARRAEFGGGVQVEDGDGTMRSEQAVVYLKASGSEKSEADAKQIAGFLGGRVDRIVASGRVEVAQPGRRANGEQLVYTAADGMFVMTGGPGIPPKMMDEAQGAITGASLRFHAGDNSVAVTNGPDGVAGQRVRSETRVKQ